MFLLLKSAFALDGEGANEIDFLYDLIGCNNKVHVRDLSIK